MWWAADNHSFMCHKCAKQIINQAVIDKISFFSQNGPKFHILKKTASAL